MRVQFSTTFIASGGVNSANDISLNGTRGLDPTSFFRAAANSYYDRANEETEFRFTTTQTFNSVALCESYLLTLQQSLPGQADLICYCDNEDGTLALQATLAAAVRANLRVARVNGCCVIIEYTFRGGIFISSSTPVPPATNSVQSGTLSLNAGDTSATITFAPVFGSTPKVFPSISIPNGGFSIACSVDRSTLTTSGCTIRFGAAMPATGYELDWFATV